jgi:hypothetical protein
VPVRHIEDDEVLTQYGTTDQDFHTEPRVAGVQGMSVIAGGWDPIAAGDIVRYSGALGDGTDAARYTTAGTLRAEGLEVTHTPNRRNPEHVRVQGPGDWGPDESAAFDRSFGPIQVGENLDDGLEEEDDRA